LVCKAHCPWLPARKDCEAHKVDWRKEALLLRERVAVLERRSAATPEDVEHADEIDATLQTFDEIMAENPQAVAETIEMCRGILRESQANFNACARLEAKVRDIAAAVLDLPLIECSTNCPSRASSRAVAYNCTCDASTYNDALVALRKLCHEP